MGSGSVLEAAHGFDGAAFVEIFQNCIVYNDGVYNSFTDRDKEADAQIHVKHGEPLTFGADKSKGLAFDAQVDDAARSSTRGRTRARCSCTTRRTACSRALLLALAPPEFPVALGVILRQPGQSFEKAYYAHQPTKLERTGRVADALRQTSTWTVPVPDPRKKGDIPHFAGMYQATTTPPAKCGMSPFPLARPSELHGFRVAHDQVVVDG